MDTVKTSRDVERARRGDTAMNALTRSTAVPPLLLLLVVLATSCGSPSGVVPAGATMGTCPVCHMKVAASDDWAAEIYFNDGTKVMFESPTDMFAFYLAPEAFQSDAIHSDPANIERVMVKDYQSKQTIDARQATLVFKSKVEGPMGPDILPFGKREDAEAFVATNGGSLLAFRGIMSETIRDLRK
jgi:nitrous oxide reductase accessory protein NosL